MKGFVVIEKSPHQRCTITCMLRSPLLGDMDFLGHNNMRTKKPGLGILSNVIEYNTESCRQFFSDFLFPHSILVMFSTSGHEELQSPEFKM